MLFGAERKTAADYSFMAAVPLMFAATFFELAKSWSTLGQSEWLFLGVGLVVAFISALVAIKLFISLLGRLGLAPFAWYRLALAPLVYWVFA
jgi:undecaprenyl-diphosphatase